MLPFSLQWKFLLLSFTITLGEIGNEVTAFMPTEDSGLLQSKARFQPHGFKCKGILMMDPSNEIYDSTNESQSSENKKVKVPTTGGKAIGGWLEELRETSPIFQIFQKEGKRKIPPFFVEDAPLLFYDVLLILNLTASISFWVVHRMSFDYIGAAVSEGSLFCILWIFCGLYNGAFLSSAVDGHYGALDERGGPLAAGRLAFNTFINASSLRVLLALVTAVTEHRQVGVAAGEDLILMEIPFGIVLMCTWRLLHSSYTPRI